MKIDYIHLRDTFITFLESVNTSTAAFNLSAGLSMTVKDVKATDILLHNDFSSRFPLIAVKLLSKESEEPETIRNTPAWNATVNMELTAIYESFSNTDTNLGKLVSNIEANIRNNCSLDNYSVSTTTSTTILKYMAPGSVQFNTFQDENCPFNRSATMNVLFYLHTKP